MLPLFGLIHFFEPLRVANIVVGNAVDLTLEPFARYLFYLFGWYASVNGAFLANSAFQHYGTGGYDAVSTNLYIIHNDSTHANKYIIGHFAAVNDGIVADGDIVTYFDGGFLIRAMDTGPILHIYLIAHTYTIDIATNDGIEPDAGVGSQ